MLILKLFPLEFAGMVEHLSWTTRNQRMVPFSHQHLRDLVLLEYRDSLKPERVMAWFSRTPRKQYRLAMKTSVAKALHQSLLFQDGRSDMEQLFLNALDQAIVNYQPPHATTIPYQIEAY